MLHLIIHTATSTFVFAFSWLLIVQLFIQIGLPLIVGLITKETTAGRTRALLLAALTIAATVLNGVASALTGNSVDFFSLLVIAIGGFVISVGFQFGIWGASGPGGSPSLSQKAIAVGSNK